MDRSAEEQAPPGRGPRPPVRRSRPAHHDDDALGVPVAALWRLIQGDKNYTGDTGSGHLATLQRYTEAQRTRGRSDVRLRHDAGCGSATWGAEPSDTTWSSHTRRSDIFNADARSPPLEDEKADFSSSTRRTRPTSIIRTTRDASATSTPAVTTGGGITTRCATIAEIDRVPAGPAHALYVSDSFRKASRSCRSDRSSRSFESTLSPWTSSPWSATTRSLQRGNFGRRGREFLPARFNHLFIMRKSDGRGRVRARRSAASDQSKPKSPGRVGGRGKPGRSRALVGGRSDNLSVSGTTRRVPGGSFL